jgi:hypothetical protein
MSVTAWKPTRNPAETRERLRAGTVGASGWQNDRQSAEYAGAAIPRRGSADLKRLLLLFVLFLPGCGPMANRIWPPWEPKPTKCEQIQCNSDETCVMKDGRPKCERKAGE